MADCGKVAAVNESASAEHRQRNKLYRMKHWDKIKQNEEGLLLFRKRDAERKKRKY